MPLVFDDEVAAPPASGGRLVFDDEQPASSGRLVFDDESAPTSIESQQTPLETGARAFAQAPGQTALSAYSGLGRAAEALVGTAEKLPGPLGTVAGGLARFYTAIPRTLGPIAGDAADRSEEVYAPDRARNPKAATVGGAIGQALPMAASAVVAGPAGPMALGAGMGADGAATAASGCGANSTASDAAGRGSEAGGTTTACTGSASTGAAGADTGAGAGAAGSAAAGACAASATSAVVWSCCSVPSLPRLRPLACATWPLAGAAASP